MSFQTTAALLGYWRERRELLHALRVCVYGTEPQQTAIMIRSVKLLVRRLEDANVRIMTPRSGGPAPVSAPHISRWLSSATELHRVMSGVRCLGGYTQIRRVLDHAIRETTARKVAALVFVGDACEHEDKIDLLAGRAGELGALQTPVFVLHEGDDPVAGAALRQIAHLSGGKYLPFDLASVQRLKELLAAIAVFAVGGLVALERHAGGKPEVLRITSQLKR